jgi:hypothetical protein
METAKQLSVSLVNKPGRLSTMLAALAKDKVGLRALVVMDSGDRGSVRFVPDDLAAATHVLERMNTRFEIADVLLVDLPPQSGAFRKICARLAADHLNIDYAYCSFCRQKGSEVAVVRVNDLAKAQRVLGENGVSARRRPTLKGRRPIFAH